MAHQPKGDFRPIDVVYEKNSYCLGEGRFSESPGVKQLELVVQVGSGHRRVVSVDREVGAVPSERL